MYDLICRFHSFLNFLHHNVDLILSALDCDFSLLWKVDATNTLGSVRFCCSTDIEAVLLSALETVLGPETAVPASSLRALLQSATFSDEKQEESLQPHGVQACMNFEDFQKWCDQLPSLKKFLLNLLTPPSPGKCITLFSLQQSMQKWFCNLGMESASCVIQADGNLSLDAFRSCCTENISFGHSHPNPYPKS